MNKEVKTTKKNKLTINKNNLDLNKEVEKECSLLSDNIIDIKTKKINKSIKMVGNNESKLNLIDVKEKNNNLGQFFTTDETLQKKLYDFILNSPKLILEPSIGEGHLIDYILLKSPEINFDMYEIDKNINFLNTVNKKNIVFGDFLKKK